MSVKIENLTNRPVLLRLNSGKTLHLAPRSTSSEIMDVEVKNNAKVQKLQDRRVIARPTEVGIKAKPAAPKKEKIESPKEKVEIPKEKKQKENKEKWESTKGKITV